MLLAGSSHFGAAVLFCSKTTSATTTASASASASSTDEVQPDRRFCLAQREAAGGGQCADSPRRHQLREVQTERGLRPGHEPEVPAQPEAGIRAASSVPAGARSASCGPGPGRLPKLPQ